MTQIARNAVDETSACLRVCRYLLHDRDSKFCAAFDEVLQSQGVDCLRLPSQSLDLNAYAERWVRSVKEECPVRLDVFTIRDRLDG